MPGIDYATLRSEVGIEQVLELLAFVPTRRHGHRLRGSCPIHAPGESRGDEFWVDLQTHRYGCFACGAAGRQLDLWTAAIGLDIYPASKELCRRLGIPIPRLSSIPSRRPTR